MSVWIESTNGLRSQWNKLWEGLWAGLWRSDRSVDLILHLADNDVYNTQQLQVLGTGTPTDTHTATIYAPDHEAIYRSHAANAPVWEGGRVVTNIALQSEELLTNPWEMYGVLGATIDLSSDVPSGDFSHSMKIVSSAVWKGQKQLSKLTVGVRYIASGWIKGEVGGERAYLGDGVGTGEVFTVTTGWKRYSQSFICVNSAITVLSRDAGQTLYFTGIQFEDATGRTDTTTPSEYIPTTSAAVTKVFSTENGNSVTDNVVTEGVGAAINPQPWLKYQPARTNDLLYARDLSGDPYGSNVLTTYNQIGATGEENTATLLSDNSAGGTGEVYSGRGATVGGGEICTFAVLAEKNSLTCVRLGCVAFDANEHTWFDLLNVVVGEQNHSAAEIIDCGNGVCMCMVEFTTTTDLTGTLRIYLSTGATSASSQVDLDGTSNIIVHGRFLYQGKTISQVRDLGPIFTTTAAASTDATVIDFDEDVNDVEGALYCEVEFSFDDAEVSGDHEILSTTTGASLLYYDSDNQQIESTDGTSTAVKALTVAKNTTYQLGLIWDTAAGMRVCVDGEWGTAVAYDGSFTGTSLLAFRNLDYCAKIRNVKVYDKGGVPGKNAIDVLMGA